MLQAVSMAPSTATANINTMNAGNMAQLQNLQGYSSLIGGNYGGTSTTPRFNNPIGGAMGGAMMGYQMGGPMGALVGGGLGLLGSQ